MRKVQNTIEKHSDGERIQTPKEAITLCERLFEVTANLISVLDRETELVRKSKIEDFAALNMRKQALTNTMTRDIKTFKLNVDYIRVSVPEQITILKEQQDHFHRSLEINHKALAAMKSVSEQLLQTIAKKIGAKQAGPEIYGRNANMNLGTKPASSAISVDTNL